jgi:hypothetical protein
MDEKHCRVLGTYSRTDLEITLANCIITVAGATVLAEVLGRNQGPTKLDNCHTDNFALADGLRGNSRLESFNPLLSGDFEIGNRQLLEISDALEINKGLLKLKVCIDRRRLSYETWDAFWDSLKTHLTLEVLDLSTILNYATTNQVAITSRVQALLGMMKVNTSIHTIHLRDQYSVHELFRASVIPYLGTNRLRPCVRAIQKHARLRTVPRCWDEPFCQLVRM